MSKELSLLSVQPHPDDESIGMGGTLARYSAEGLRTTLVTATRGEVGEILDKDLDPKEAAPRLASIREGELRNAVRNRVLGCPTSLDRERAASSAPAASGPGIPAPLLAAHLHVCEDMV